MHKHARTCASKDMKRITLKNIKTLFHDIICIYHFFFVPLQRKL